MSSGWQRGYVIRPCAGGSMPKVSRGWISGWSRSFSAEIRRATMCSVFFFFFSSRRRHTRCSRDWSSDVCSSDLKYADEWAALAPIAPAIFVRNPNELEKIKGTPVILVQGDKDTLVPVAGARRWEIGRASCRERV